MIEAESITEKLKATNSMLWTGKLNCIENKAFEVVDLEIVYM